MSIKGRNKKVRICLIVGAICILLGFWAVLLIPETAMAAKPGNIPVCIAFEAEGGIQSDNGEYCDDKQLKIEAIMTPDGHVNLRPNTGRGEGRILIVDVDLNPDYPEVNIESTEGWRFLVGGWQDSFDMRAMEIGQARHDVNLMINVEAPPNDENIVNWRLFFDPGYINWGIDYSDSTYITVKRISTDAWEVEVDNNDRAVLVKQMIIKKKSEFARLKDLVSVPPFKATVTLVP
jgi:hypothetical protein